MRIELIYSPGCQSAKETLSFLERVIAEEQLPIPIELVERVSAAPIVRINGTDLHSENTHDLIRSSISDCWRAHSAPVILAS